MKHHRTTAADARQASLDFDQDGDRADASHGPSGAPREQRASSRTGTGGPSAVGAPAEAPARFPSAVPVASSPSGIGVESAMPTDVPDTAFALALASRLGRLARCRGASQADVAIVEQVAALLGRSVALGHVCVPFGAVCARLQVPASAARQALSAAALLGSDAPLVLDAAGRLYLARHDDAERRLALGLLALLPAPRPVAAAGALDDSGAGKKTLAARLARGFGRGVDGQTHGGNNGEVDWQRVGAALALHSRLAVISGGPGTGKTTTVAAIIACLLDAEPDLSIALAAPTGKAAQRMLEALAGRASALPAELAARFPTVSFTLHRLLGTRADGTFRHGRGAPLPYDVVVVDEASMIDLAMAARLADALPTDARLILLGDKDQLSAVEAGAVFAELCAQPALSSPLRARFAAALDVSPDRLRQGVRAAGGVAPALPDTAVWLERNFRFGAASPIGRLAVAVRDGDADAARAAFSNVAAAALSRDDGQAAALWVDAPGGAPLDGERLDAIVDGYAGFLRALADWRRSSVDQLAGLEVPNEAVGSFGSGTGGSSAVGTPTGRRDELARLFDALARYRVLCAVREGPRGTNALNGAVAARVRALADAHRTSSASGWPAVASEWFNGRTVMITRNDYPLRLFNGDIGIALEDERGGLRVYFPDAANAGGFRSLSPAALPPLDSAFAMTVHKSQGSEFDAVALVLPPPGARGTSRELVYTGITRAKRRVALIGDAGLLADAVATPTRRDSGLLDRIRRYRASGDGVIAHDEA